MTWSRTKQGELLAPTNQCDMSFTPPSTVGDIVAIVTLALQIRQALSDSRGASNDYRDLIDELDAFRSALAVIEDRILASPPSEGPTYQERSHYMSQIHARVLG